MLDKYAHIRRHTHAHTCVHTHNNIRGEMKEDRLQREMSLRFRDKIRKLEQHTVSVTEMRKKLILLLINIATTLVRYMCYCTT